MKKIILLSLFLLALPISGFTQSTNEVRAVITSIIDEHTILAEDVDGKEYEAELATTKTDGFDFNLKTGDKVYLEILDVGNSQPNIYFGDIYRVPGIVWIFLIFSVIAVAVGRRKGFFAIVGLLVTMLVLFDWVLPAIIAGADAVVTVVLASIVILAVNMHFAHGFKKSTFIAFLSALSGLILVLIFTYLFVALGHLTGLATEDAVMVYVTSAGTISAKGVLLAGIILGAVGVLDDVTITQQETVEELTLANSNFTDKELFASAMRIGRHHIAADINTLVLAYAGVALPLFIIFIMSGSIPMERFINEEFVSEEIIRTLAGTTALILTVPLATWFALLFRKR